MFEVNNKQLESKNNGYKAVIDERLNIFYNKEKFNEFAQDFILLTNILPNTDVLKQCKEENANLFIIDVIKNNRRKIIKEINRIMKISPKYLNTNYFNDLMKLLNIYHEMLYL